MLKPLGKDGGAKLRVAECYFFFLSISFPLTLHYPQVARERGKQQDEWKQQG